MPDPAVPFPPEPFTRRVVIAVAISIVGLALALFFWYAMYVLMLAFAGVLVAVALRSMALAVGAWTRLRTGYAMALVIGTIVLALGLAVGLLAPRIARQVDEFTDRLPGAVSAMEERLAEYEWGRQLLGRETPPRADAPDPPGVSDQPPGAAPSTAPVGALTRAVEPKSIVRLAVTYASVLVQGTVSVLVVLVVGIYLGADPHLYERGLLHLLPRRHRPRISAVLCEISEVLQKWMTAQLIPMAAVGTVTGVGLWLLGIRAWLTLGLLAGMFNFIPNFGPLISLVPAALFALAEGGPHKALSVVLLYVFAQSLEGYVLTPMVQDRAVKLPPALTILVQVLMGLLMGGIGIVLAAPLAAAAMVVVKRLYVEDVLGGRTASEGAGSTSSFTGRHEPRTGRNVASADS